MGMIPVGPRASRLEIENVVVLPARSDRIKRTSIGRVRNVEPMPVNRCRLGQLIPEVNNDVVAFVRFEPRTGDLSVVCEALGRFAGEQNNPGLPGDESYFDCMWLSRFIYKN